jgi:hypothetical protein
VRRIIHDQIYAREVAQLIPHSDTLRQINGILEGRAHEFGFQGMRIARASALEDDRIGGTNGRAALAWRLDHPIVADDSDEDDPYVLRISCGPRPHGAERVARIVAPAIQEWLVKSKVPGQTRSGPAIGGEQGSGLAERAV